MSDQSWVIVLNLYNPQETIISYMIDLHFDIYILAACLEYHGRLLDVIEFTSYDPLL